MTAVLVQGLSGEGPGDIVGAFVNECGIAPDAIGEIEIDGDAATVALDDGVVDAVVREMDGGTVGTSTVRVRRLDEATETARSYVDRYRELVELERQAEMERHESEIRSLSGREREAKGRALLHMRGRDEGEGLGGYLVKFLRERRSEALPETEIGVGDLVMVSKQDPLRDDNPTGTVAEQTRYSITVAFDGRPPGFVFDDGLRVDLYVNDITFRRMQDALKQLPDADGPLAALRDVLVGVEEPAPPEPAQIETWHNESLNDSQRTAVRRALGAERFHLIHGPPGTGKTTTAVEVIEQAVDRGESVLATAASNTAVDTLLEFLIERGVDAVRVGHPARVTPTLREHTLDSRLAGHPKYQRRSELREEAFDLLDEQEQYTHPSGRWRRGLSDERIRSLAEEGRGARGVPPEKMREMAEWLRLQEEADELFEEADRLEQEALAEVIEEAEVVCTTNSTAGSDLLEGAQFDLLVIDEATQATEPSCLIPITHADRVVMAGDHRQLPPTVQSEEAAREGLRETLFERLAERHPRIRDMLRVQYRMHETIMGFSSERFYDGELEAAPSVTAHTLSDLAIDPTTLSPPDILDPGAPLVFVDTADLDAPERQRSGSTSRENPGEATIVKTLAESLLEAGVDPRDIAVISPYDDQVDRLSSELDREGLEVDTVDGFQGREKEVVLVSLVRSNKRGEIGFLAEERRFNVAVTRAKRKVVVVGDGETVTRAPVFEEFVEYAADSGRLVRP
ncbi:MAG: IGHMBP2 family helicase [Halodesulfurarchaeum sp.]